MSMLMAVLFKSWIQKTNNVASANTVLEIGEKKSMYRLGSLNQL